MSDSELIGQQIGQYTILSKLGEGGMASVYRARQLSINRDVAIKVIRSRLAQTPEYMRRFEREARTLASLDHLHILKIFDFGQQGDLLYLVMEIKTGGNFSSLIRRGTLSLGDTARYLDQIGAALDYAHRKGVVHRDLKPQNVLLDESGNAILTDFGIAKLITKEATQLTNTGAVMGTPAYMAPELWQGGNADARTDIYALGIMLYEMLSGTLPFAVDTPAQMMFFHIQTPPPQVSLLRAGLPRSLDPVLGKAIAKQPDDRFSSGRSLSDAFAQAIRDPNYTPASGSMLSFGTPSPTRDSKTPSNSLLSTIAPPTRLGQTSSAPTAPTTPYAANTPTQTAAARGGNTRLLMLGLFAVIAVLIGIVVLLIARPQPAANTTPTGAAAALASPSDNSTIAAVPPISTATVTPNTPTIGPSNTATLTATPTISPSPSLTLTPSLQSAEMTLTAQIIRLTSLASVTTGEALRQTQAANLTLTASAIALTLQANQQTSDAAQRAILALSFTPTPTPTITPSPSLTPTSTPSVTFTSTHTPTPTPSLTATPSPTPSLTSTFTATASPTLTPTFTIAFTPTSEPPRGIVIFASKRGAKYQLYGVNVANLETRRIAQTTSDDFGPALSWDGQRIAFTSNRSGANELYSINTDGSDLKRLTRLGADSYAPAWSPDGTQIVFHSNRSGDFELYLVNVNDPTNPIRLTTNNGDDSDASWSPDGKSIAFHSKRDTKHSIYIMNASNPADISRLTPDDIDAFDPAWSPDGQTVAFTTYVNRKPQVYLINVDGSFMRPLLNAPIEEDQPAWDPTSRYLVFRSKRNGRTDLYRVDAGGQNIERLTNAGDDNQFPSWQSRSD